MNIELLIWSGFIIYTANYIIGWLLFSGIISMSKKTHQFFFVTLILNLILLLFADFNFTGKIICSLSLICLIVLPLGRKGGVYHIAVSSLGFFLFAYLFYINLI